MNSIISFKDMTPKIGKESIISPSAKIIGDVEIGDKCFIGPNTVIRGDIAHISIGNYNIFEGNCIIIPGEDFSDGYIKHLEVIIGNYGFTGYNSTIRGSYLGDHFKLGSNVTIERGVQMNEGVFVLSGSVIATGTIVPPMSVLIGNPAHILRKLTFGEKEKHEDFIEAYFEFFKTYETPI
ncbi:MAG: gamma carbonic anhydrase family protein [Candidatus Odinarchaeia archaeon]